MKPSRLTEVLLPLLAARGWAPWQVEPESSQRQRRLEARRIPAAHTLSWRDRQQQRRSYDDVQ
jgi:hypothetical protein